MRETSRQLVREARGMVSKQTTNLMKSRQAGVRMLKCLLERGRYIKKVISKFTIKKRRQKMESQKS